MAQFTVYRNPDSSTHDSYPYMLDIQHAVIDELSTRLVIPLGRYEHFRKQTIETLTPVVEFDGEKLLLLTHQLSSVPTGMLREPVGSLAQLRDEIIAAIDLAVSGF